MFSKLNPPLAMELQYNVSYSTCDKRRPCVQVSGECVQVHHNQLTVHQLTWSGVRNAPTDFGTMYDSRTAEGQTVKDDINFYQGS